MKKLLIIAGMAWGLQSVAGHAYSAHFCQPYKNGGEPAVGSYYQNFGSIYVAKQIALHCPIMAESQAMNGTVHVRLAYSSYNVNQNEPVKCRVWKMGSANNPIAGEYKSGFPNQQSGFLDIRTQANPAGAIGASIECQMKPGTKLVGYWVY